MPKVRVHVLAKELGIPSKVLVERCRDEGLTVKSHMSSISEEIAEKFRREFGGEPAAKKEPKKKAAPEKPAAKKAPAAEKAPPKAKPKKAASKEAEKAPAKAKPKEAGKAPAKPSTPAPPARVPAPSEGEAAPKRRRIKTFQITQQEDTPDAPAGTSGQTTGTGRYSSQRIRRPFRRRDQQRPRFKPEPTGPEKGKTYEIEPPVTVRSLSTELGLKQNVIIQELMRVGMMVTINDALGEEAILTIATKYEIEIEQKQETQLEEQVLAEAAQEDKPEDLKVRSPVVTFLGHVDHGKTSLLDRIRNTDVAGGESGGITQHIGAHTVRQGDAKVVFLDTPGHEAFTAMRARGANVTDVVVLVVACDDGVMPQTEEAIHHAQAAEVPIVVALNKIDRPNAKPERVLQQLSALGLQPEEWGGETICVRTSAITGEGVEDLLEMLVLQSEILELKANPAKAATGTVLESERTEGRGVETTLLVQDGSLNRGDYIIAGETSARVRALFDDRDKPLRSAGPATPVKVTGFSEVPEVSSSFFAVKDLQTARAVAENRAQKSKVAAQAPRTLVTLETLREHLDAGETKEVRFIVRADVQGSLEVLNKAINDLSGAEISTRILHSAVGAITESDVLLAEASDALVVGFNVVPDDRARSLADDRGVNVRTYQVIYQFIEEVRSALEGMLDPEEVEKLVGHAEVRQIFNVSRFGTIAGCYMRDGIIQRSSRVRLIRDGVIVHTGRLASLRRVKDDVREVREGLECGMKIEGYDDVKVGDIIEAFEIEKVARVLSSV